MVVAALVLQVVDQVAGKKRSHSMRKFENSSNAAFSPLSSSFEVQDGLLFHLLIAVTRSRPLPRALGLLHFQVRGGEDHKTATRRYNDCFLYHRNYRCSALPLPVNLYPLIQTPPCRRLYCSARIAKRFATLLKRSSGATGACRFPFCS
jgi:hypothetical protein